MDISALVAVTDTLIHDGSLIPFASPQSVKKQKISDDWGKLITGVDQSFESIKDFRDLLQKYAIANKFTYKFLKNDGTRVTAVCSTGDCQWKIQASALSPTHNVLINAFNDEHTCEGKSHTDGNRLANHRWVASIIKDKLRDSPHYKPREIASDLQRDYGLNLNYTQAWRGKSFAQRELLNIDGEVCDELPWFCERIRKTNPGSVATLVISDDDSLFERLFVSFYASLHGFEHGCRPLLFLNGISLKMSKQWKLLVATSVDAQNDVFPVAFALVLVEDEENWIWFLGELKLALSTSRTITFISNRQACQREAVAKVFGDSSHGHCFSDLVEEFRLQLESKDALTDPMKESLMHNLKQSAHAYKADEFNECIETINAISEEAAEWVLNSQPELWSNASFKGLRLDTLSSHASDLFHSWLGKVGRQESSVIQIVDWIRCKLMETIHTRRESANTWSEMLTSSANNKLEQESTKSCSLELVSATGHVYEVRDTELNVVNLETRECTCRKWQVSGLPCMHAISVIQRNQVLPLSDYCSEYFLTEFYRLTYSQCINPIPDVGRPISFDSPNKYPLRTPRLPGRPKQKPAELERMISKRTVKCSKCKEYGHNKATCKTEQHC